MNKFEFRSARQLNRRELKNIRGGDGSITPGTPTGGDCEQKQRKCCLTEFPDICSACILTYSNANCGAGATLTDC